MILSGVGIAQTTRQTAMILLAGNSWLFRQFWALPCLSTLSWFFNFHPSLNILLRKSFGLSRFWCFLKAVFMSSSKIKPCQWLKGTSGFFKCFNLINSQKFDFLGQFSLVHLIWEVWFAKFGLVCLVGYCWFFTKLQIFQVPCLLQC